VTEISHKSVTRGRKTDQFVKSHLTEAEWLAPEVAGRVVMPRFGSLLALQSL